MFSEELEINKFSPHVEPEGKLIRYAEFQEKIMQAYFPLDIVEPRDMFLRNLRLPPSKTWKQIRYVVEDSDKIVAEGNLGFRNLEKGTNPEFCEIWVLVDPDYSGKGIGKAILSILVEEAKREGKTRFSAHFCTGTPIKKGLQWLEKIGAKKVLEEKKNRLYREDVNWDFIQEQKRILTKKLATYQFEIISSKEHLDRIEKDDKYAEERADFLTEVGNLIPRGESEEKDEIVTKEDLRKDIERSRNSSWESRFVFAYDGDRLIGQTGVFHWKNSDFPYVGTGLTGVRAAYQGQGLAKLLKCIMVEDIFGNFPKVMFIETENAENNASMLSINERLGFKEVYRWLQFEGQIATLQGHLGE